MATAVFVVAPILPLYQACCLQTRRPDTTRLPAPHSTPQLIVPHRHELSSATLPYPLDVCSIFEIIVNTTDTLQAPLLQLIPFRAEVCILYHPTRSTIFKFQHSRFRLAS